MDIYIHTLDGKPAVFDGEQVCFMPASRGGNGYEPAYSLAQIRREQRQAAAWRKDHGYEQKCEMDYRRYRIAASGEIV